MEELFELKRGNLTMDAYKNRFLEILTYDSDYTKDKIQIFLSNLPTFYRDNI